MASTRLVIKNLPHYCTPERLRTHFTDKRGPGGKITDVKVSFKSDGTSRRFGFVGYKTSEEALKAKEWFHKTFIDSARLQVDLVKDDADPSQRPTKRRRVDEPSSSKPLKADPTPLNKQLDSFLEVMQPRNKGPSWTNEEKVAEPVKPEVGSSGAAEKDTPEEPDQETLSDMEWLKRRMTERVDEVDAKMFEQSDDEFEGEKKLKEPAAPPVQPQPTDPVAETIRQTARLFVRNLAFLCTEDELLELFSPYGTVAKVHLPTDPSTKQGKGIAYISYTSPDDALVAYKSLDKKAFQGRLLHILGAVDRKGTTSVTEASGKSTVKDERMANRKALAGKEFNWSMLYMNSDAVASSIADRMNIPKTSILNPDSSDGPSSNPAVKLALAETHIITETKSFLESHGVLLSSFSNRVRSDTILLVKNIPYGTTEDAIREMFEGFGTLTRVLVPPAGTIAVVEFEKGEEAGKALKGVAYRRLGNSIVYLEKGPVGMFMEGGGVKETSAEDKELLSKTVIKAPLTGVATEDGPEGAGATLYVKNLSFATTQDKLVQLFSNLPSFSFARIQTKPDPKRPGSRLSMGYGFIGFKDVEGAEKASKSLQGFVVDGHELSVKFAGRGREEMAKEVGAAGGAKARTTKIIVKNLPFEATKKDVRDLFGVHGKLKSVRVPKKFDARTRGFAFLEFVTRHEAENAFNALKHTHLLGRHLVLEWAAEEEHDIDALRRKAGVGLGDGTALPGKKRKIDMGDKGDPEDVEM